MITALGLASSASAAPPIGADGQIHGCYVAKGKKQGTLRVLPAGKKCKKKRKEKPIAWSVQGPPGTPGAQGAPGTQGESGISSAQLTALTERINQQDATITSLNSTITGLTTTVGGLLTQVGTLQGVLNGLTNADLTGAVAKLNGLTNADLTGAVGKLSGISGANLQSTVAALSAVNALCTRATDLTAFSNDLRTAVSGIALSGIIPAGLGLTVPGLPAALGAFSCPAF